MTAQQRLITLLCEKWQIPVELFGLPTRMGVEFTAEEIRRPAAGPIDHDQYEFNGRPVASSSLPEWFRRTMRIRAWRAR